MVKVVVTIANVLIFLIILPIHAVVGAVLGVAMAWEEFWAGDDEVI